MFRSRTQALAALAAPALALTLILPAAPAVAAPAGERPIPGFTEENSRWQRRYEKLFSAVPSAKVARDLDAELSSEPGLTTTSGDRRRVERLVARLRSYGLEPEVTTYYAYLSMPKRVKVEMTAPDRVSLPVKEEKRPWQKHYDDVIPGHNGLSPSGNVRGEVVYANYGRPQDFELLEKQGVSVRGKIVLARYGAVFRGVKPREAARRGAKAVLIYSDPADDGFTKGAVYPDGPWRAPDGIQRGSVAQIQLAAGDPQTPGWPSVKDAKRIPPSEAPMLKDLVPTTPISYGAAAPLLKALTGPEVPKEWRGGLPLTYRFGPGGTKVHLDLENTFEVRPLWNVTVRIRGSEHPEQEVILGAHHDSWTYGSSDNLSGTENVLQVGRALGKLLKEGWRPKRTVVLATWDGEEYGLFGSTEYAEDRDRELRNAVAYVNMDGAGGSHFGATTTPALDESVIDATKEVRWPGTDGTLYEAWKAQNDGKTPIGRIGGGSDFQAFFQRYGVPAMDIGAASPGTAGNYHCACDDHYWMSRFGDPDWEYHTAMSRLAGIATLRLANADVVALGYRPYAEETARYLADFTEQQRERLGSVVVDVSRDIEQAKAWARAAAALRDRADEALRDGDTAEFRRLNHKIMQAERDLLTQAGLPGRPWYRHQVFAPGLDTGYATQRLPALYDALFGDRDVRAAKEYEARLFRSLRAATRTLDPGGDR
ncbi:N-acetylated-alpha-linked acidic dipeptidase [Actinomadura pelletieri DSM 43383]|uniref:N-acetylated-alpha-linked acidic dipeptidase n=1 Tax=Actinomadura pelletieri DSM 43383 TaxID=1120940 RepID=A0A495QC47_9ACTN|nr:M28 family peptidase [Actinomadura pelletieri]RKS69131.1 N-acetylated-alpha-linked acidic dipeptidase [Actinomadura pelletieri DSM 43383]